MKVVWHMDIGRIVAAFFALLIIATACHKPESTVGTAPSLTTYSVTGVVQRLEPDGKTVVIKHQAIPSYMAAMTMPFEVKDTNELKQIKAGDQVTFRMLVGTNDAWIEKLHAFGTTNVDAAPEHQSVRLVREVTPLAVGDQLTDYTFTNQLGRAVKLSDFRGQALALTFFFTRCPFPTFCPRLSGHFSDVARRMAAASNGPTNWHMLSISFDPENDTPAKLKAYAAVYHYDPARWDFVTGAMIDIDAITEQFGLEYVYRAGTYDHKLRTVVVDANGKIQQILIGNEWTADQLVEELVKAANPGSPAARK
jgi:protein SCO1/2